MTGESPDHRLARSPVQRPAPQRQYQQHGNPLRLSQPSQCKEPSLCSQQLCAATAHSSSLFRTPGLLLASLLMIVQLATSPVCLALPGGGTAPKGGYKLQGGRGCGIVHDEQEYAMGRKMVASTQQRGMTNQNARVAFASSVTVPVAFHVITKADGTGVVTVDQMTQQVRKLLPSLCHILVIKLPAASLIGYYGFACLMDIF